MDHKKKKTQEDLNPVITSLKENQKAGYGGRSLPNLKKQTTEEE